MTLHVINFAAVNIKGTIYTMKKMIFTAATVALMTACSTTDKVTTLDSMSGEWTIEKIDGTKLDNKGETAPFIGFNTKNNQVFGSTSCNRLTGEMSADPKTGTIDLSRMGMTRMMCADMSTETKVLDALSRVKKFKVNKTTMLLTDDKGKTVVKMKKR